MAGTSVLANSKTAVGIDVGAKGVWAVRVTVDAQPAVHATLLSWPIDLDAVVAFAGTASCVAVDAPADPSDSPHDEDVRFSRKFQRARCGEVSLRRAGIAVPWVTPGRNADTVAPWIATGYSVWTALRAADLRVVETYPHGIFWRLLGAPVFHKQRPEGHLQRIAALQQQIEAPADLEMWSHDGLDALAAALLASLTARGEAECFDCSQDQGWPTHDGSAIWLPKPHIGVATLR